jgi:hypothetical protein
MRLNTWILGNWATFGLGVRHTHPLAANKGVQRLEVTGYWGAPQSIPAWRRVDSAQFPRHQGADKAASATRLTQNLHTALRHHWTLAQLLRRARSASDRLLS